MAYRLPVQKDKIGESSSNSVCVFILQELFKDLYESVSST